MNLEELEKKYEELGREIERLKKEGQEPDIEYAFTAFVSNERACRTGGIKKWVYFKGSYPQEDVIVLDASGKENGTEYGFARAYRVGGLDVIVGNNGNPPNLEPDLKSFEKCCGAPCPEVQEKHKAIIREYLANRKQESRTFRIEDIDAAWGEWVKSFGFEIKVVNSTDPYSAFTNGKSYSVADKFMCAVDNDGGVSSLGDNTTITLSLKLYQALKPYLDLSKAIGE